MGWGGEESPPHPARELQDAVLREQGAPCPLPTGHTLTLTQAAARTSGTGGRRSEVARGAVGQPARRQVRLLAVVRTRSYSQTGL